jgi:hypothetical protein
MSDELVGYLRAGVVLAATTTLARDVLSPVNAVIGGLHLLTDGRWCWYSDLAHYVERYHVALDPQFITHARPTTGRCRTSTTWTCSRWKRSFWVRKRSEPVVAYESALSSGGETRMSGRGPDRTAGPVRVSLRTMTAIIAQRIMVSERAGLDS